MAKKKAEKAANKALKKAKDAVAEAKRRAKKANGKAKRRAKKVDTDLKAVVSSVKRSAKASDARSAKKETLVATTPAPKVSSAPVAKPSGSTEDLSALTVVQLRARARAKGVVGSGKFTKAQLVAALSD